MPSIAFIQRKQALEDRQAKAVRLKVMGLSQQDIAKQLGISEATVTRDLQRAIMASTTNSDRAFVRALHVRRQEDLLMGIWPKARKGDLGAIGKALDILAQQAKLLGLNEPDRQQVEVTGGDKFVDRVDELFAMIQGDQPE